MKTPAISILMVMTAFEVVAQNYQINFAGTGAGTTVDSVKVENLTQCTSLSIAGTDTLILSATAGMNEPGSTHQFQVNVYPNPSPGNFSVEFEMGSGGRVQIGLYDVSGKPVLHLREFLQEGIQQFRLSDIVGGVYILRVESEDFFYVVKLISNSAGTGFPQIEDNASPNSNNRPFLPRTSGINGLGIARPAITMLFNEGDTLKLTGRSGNYRTVSMLFPAQSQTVTFQFVACSDTDSNHYAVVQIGSQLWMQENLKTTKYRDGSDIPNVPDSAAWGNLTTGAYCDYHNLPAEGEYYGRLYNYYAVADNRKMCPAGWHVPSHSEWNILEKFLDNTVDTTSLGGSGTRIGRILKEGCDTRWAYLDSTYGLNSAGFTALCSNFRNASGAWSLAPGDNHDDCFWTSTSYNASSAWFRSLRWCFSDIYSLFPMKKGGYSVRCIKDY
jgi:uncharacterized protein (TIGR02145 family)